jgi:hypothetical protein
VVLCQSWGLYGDRILRPNSRARVWTSYTLEIMHLPSGLRARGQVSPGHYSRPQIIAHRQALQERLVKQLAAHVLAWPAPRFTVIYGGLKPHR